MQEAKSERGTMSFIKMFMFLSFLVPILSYSDIPLWEHEKKIQWRKCLLIESSLLRMHELCDSLESELREQIECEIDIIKFNLNGSFDGSLLDDIPAISGQFSDCGGIDCTTRDESN